MNKVNEAWSDQLWLEVERLAAGHSGPEVIRALKAASEAVWDAGLDHAFNVDRKSMDLETAAAFDITWLTALAIWLATA